MQTALAVGGGCFPALLRMDTQLSVLIRGQKVTHRDFRQSVKLNTETPDVCVISPTLSVLLEFYG